jgi:acetoin utilization protein AcuB
MLVKDYMTPHPILVAPEMRVTEAQKVMSENNIRHLPVVSDGKRLLGLVTRQRLAIPPEKLASLDVWEITRFLADLNVSKVMVTGADLHTTTPEMTLEEAADMLIRYKISGLPVIEAGGVVCGIITETDLLIEFQNLLGAPDAGWRAVMRVPDKIGQYRKLVRAISENNWGLMALGGVRSPKHPDKWDVVLKVRHCTKEQLTAVLQSIEDQELIDIRETRAQPA